MSELSSDASVDNLWTEVISNSSEEDAVELKAVRGNSDNILLPKSLLGNDTENLDSSEVATLIGDMTVAQKIKLAMFGNKTARSALIRDTSKQIPMFVLQNPRLTEDEVLEFARNSNVSETVLRVISGESKWTKNYALKLALASNSKTSIDIGLRWIKYIRERDLRKLAKSKDISSVLSTQCKKLLEKRRR